MLRTLGITAECSDHDRGFKMCSNLLVDLKVKLLLVYTVACSMLSACGGERKENCENEGN